MACIRAFSALLCLLSLPALARPVPMPRVPPGRVVAACRAHIRYFVSPPGKFYPSVKAKRLGASTSPDGQYAALATSGEAEAVTLTVRRAGRQAQGRRALLTVPDVDGFVWVPGQAHTLVMAAEPLYGQGRLALWRGTPPLMPLRPSSPNEEGYRLLSVSADGRTIRFRKFNGDTFGPVCTGRLPR